MDKEKIIEKIKTDVEHHISDWFDVEVDAGVNTEEGWFDVKLTGKHGREDKIYEFDACISEDEKTSYIDMNSDGNTEEISGETLFRWLYFEEQD